MRFEAGVAHPLPFVTAPIWSYRPARRPSMIMSCLLKETLRITTELGRSALERIETAQGVCLSFFKLFWSRFRREFHKAGSSSASDTEYSPHSEHAEKYPGHDSLGTAE